MYWSIVKLNTIEGQREALIEILLGGVHDLPAFVQRAIASGRPLIEGSDECIVTEPRIGTA